MSDLSSQPVFSTQPPRPTLSNLGVLARWLIFTQTAICIYSAIKSSFSDFFYLIPALEVIVFQYSFLFWLALFVVNKNNLFSIKYNGNNIYLIFLLGFSCALTVFFLPLFSIGNSGPFFIFCFSTALMTLAFCMFEELFNRAKEVDLVKAQTELLFARIKPHFMFNTLNTALALIRTNPAKSEVILEKLSILLREVVKDSNGLVSLSHDLEIINAYIEIENFRLEPFFIVNFSISEEVLDDDPLIPSFILQPLIENAIHYCDGDFLNKSTIDLVITKSSGFLVITITNPVSSKALNHGSGISLANIKARLLCFYDVESSIVFCKTLLKWTVTIKIPYTCTQN